MLRVWISRIRPEKESRVRTWLAELTSRSSEVLATFRDETARAEQAFANSTHKIDAEHKAVMRECLAEPLTLTPLYGLKL